MFVRTLGILGLLIFGSTLPSVAQEGGLLAPSTGLMFWTILTFVIVLIVLWKAALPPILSAVEAREQQIRDLIAAAERDRQEAQTALAEQNRLLEDTRSRVQEMVSEGKTAGERVKEEIMSDARKQADELLVRARREVRQELDRAREQLRVEGVEIALAAASKLIERNLDQDDNRRLVQSFLADLEARDSTASPAGV